MRVRRLLPLVFLCVLAFPAHAQAGGPSMVLGTNENLALQKSFVAAKANMSLARLAGFQALSLRTFWWPGVTAPRDYDLLTLGNIAKAARLLGMPVYLSITNTLGRYTPRTEEDRGQFAEFTAGIARQFPYFKKIIVGNEPNLNMFWSPQFDFDGSDLAALGYERLLAQTYDAVKAVSPGITVIGGAVSPRGHDDPTLSSKSHSPTTFIRDLGSIYRASGRTKPIMDWFAIHPYQDNSSQLPTTRHSTSTTISIADYDKLVNLLGQAFDGTKQVGSAIPIIYDEYGIESTIPPKKAKKYTGTEPKSTKPVPPAVQGQRYKQAIQLAFCQPTVRGLFLFHAFDEPGRPQWQSGLYYVDHTRKPSLAIVRQAFQEAKRGIAARCPGLRLRVKAKAAFPAPGQAAAAGKRGGLKFRIHCDLDCRYTAGVIQLSNGRSVLASAGQAVGGKNVVVKLPARSLGKGQYRLVVSLVAAVNPGPAVRKASRPFSVR
jgi:hypothetical protein